MHCVGGTYLLCIVLTALTYSALCWRHIDTVYCVDGTYLLRIVLAALSGLCWWHLHTVYCVGGTTHCESELLLIMLIFNIKR